MMKTHLPFCILTLLLTLAPVSAMAQRQAERFREARITHGDRLYEALFFLPETKDTMRKHIPNLDQWVGFETNFWKELPEKTKVKILDDVGADADSLKKGGAELLWGRIRDWISIDMQLGLLTGFSDSEEDIMDIYYEDPLLRPTFKWLLERRPKYFDTKYVGATFSSGELATFYPMLVERLLDSSRKERFACFARVFSRLAKDADVNASPADKEKP